MDASDFKDYLSKYNIHELFKGLMFGLTLSKPSSPIKYLIESLQNLQNQNIESITWKSFLESKPQISQEPSEQCIKPESNLTFMEIQGLVPEGEFPGRLPSVASTEDNIPFTMKPVVLIIGEPESEKIKFAQQLREDNPNWVIVSRFTYTIMKFVSIDTLKETPMDKSFIQKNLDKCPNAQCFIVVDYPVTMEQVAAFEHCIKAEQLIVVIYIHIEEDLSIKKCLTKLKSQISISSNIPALIALHIQTYKVRMDPVIKHYKRIRKFIQIDKDTQQDKVIFEIQKIIKDYLHGMPQEEIQEQIKLMSCYKDLETPIKETALPPNISFYPHFPKCPIILLTGRPGCQKLQHASSLALKYQNLDVISVGQMICSSINYPSNSDCSQWRTITASINGEDFEPQFDVIDVISKKIENAVQQDKSILVFGYPKNTSQLEKFNTMIGLPTTVIYLKCSEEETVKVLLERMQKATYSVNNLLAITNEINCFEKHTLPVIDYYKTMSRLVTLDTDFKSFQLINNEIYEEIMRYIPRVEHNQ